jgi:tripartite ATP-independent transporter DctM subunit
MSPEIIGLLGLVVLVILLFARMWIGAAMALVGFIGYICIMGINPAYSLVSIIPFSTMTMYMMTTVPLYVFMGVVLFQSGVGADLYETAYKWVGQFWGGLASATVIACALFAAITGISAPAIVTMGKVALPAMRKYNYSDNLALGSIVCAGTLAFLIPPSVVLIIYGVLTETSISRLYMAGFIPGILLAGLFVVVILLITLRNPKAGPVGPKTSFKDKVISLKLTWPMVFLFLLVLGGIYMGVFTPTEGGAVGAFGALVITFSMRRLNFKKFVDSLLEATQTTAMVMLLIIGAYILMKFLAVSQLTTFMGETVAGLNVPTGVIFIGIVLLYIILGMFLDIISAVILTIPVIFPLIEGLGLDPIWFGVIVVILVEMGLVTPPVGMDAFVLAGAIDIPVGKIFRSVLPFLVAMLVCIALLYFFPDIALWLPSTMR